LRDQPGFKEAWTVSFRDLVKTQSKAGLTSPEIKAMVLQPPEMVQEAIPDLEVQINRAFCRAENAWSNQRRGSTLAMKALGTLWWRTKSREWRPAHVLRKLEAGHAS
jgi:hypothetical protein